MEGLLFTQTVETRTTWEFDAGLEGIRTVLG